MASIINATTTAGVSVQGDNSGSLQLQTNSGTTAVTIDTSQNVTFAKPITVGGNTLGAGNATSFKNRIIDGGFTINQRGYTSGTSLSSGSYGHDRWKGGASGGTYTFTQGSTGVNTTITITAGSIIQVIEGANLPEGGTYVLSWTGTAQGKIGSGSFGASGITGTITAGTNTNIEFNTGTCGNVQLEVGSTATSFDYRPYGTELALCQRYLPAFSCASGEKLSHFGTVSSSAGWATVPFQVPTRVSPTGITSNSNWVMSSFGTGSTPAGALTFNAGSQFSITVAATGASTFVAGQIGNLQASGGTATFYGTGCEL